MEFPEAITGRNSPTGFEKIILLFHHPSSDRLPFPSPDLHGSLLQSRLWPNDASGDRRGGVRSLRPPPPGSLSSLGDAALAGHPDGLWPRSRIWNKWATFTGGLGVSILLFKGIALVLSLAILFFAYRYCSSKGDGLEGTRAFTFLALNPVLLWEISSQAHNDAVIVLSIVCFVYFSSLHRKSAALISLIAGFIAKLSTLPILGFYLVYLFIRSRIRVIWPALGLCVIVGIFAFFFPQKITSALVFPMAESFDPLRVTNSLVYLLYMALKPLGAKVQLGGFQFYWTTALALLGFLAIYWARNTRKLEDVYLFSFLFLLASMLIFAPNYQPWYIAWLLPLGMALKEFQLQKFLGLFSVLSMALYPIYCGPTVALLNLIILILFFRSFRSPLLEKPENLYT